MLTLLSPHQVSLARFAVALPSPFGLNSIQRPFVQSWPSKVSNDEHNYQLIRSGGHRRPPTPSLGQVYVFSFSGCTRKLAHNITVRMSGEFEQSLTGNQDRENSR